MERKASAVWTGGLKDGKGEFSTPSGVFSHTPYSFKTRFEDAPGTNPEELIGAAHAGCFSMAFSAQLANAGFPPKRVRTTAAVHFDKVGDAFSISRIDLECEGEVTGIDNAKFQQLAETAKKGCPVSKALAGTQINLKARLVTTAAH